MKLLIIGRSFPDVETGMVGIFEFEQAEAVSKYYGKPIEIIYTFCDNRSVLRLRRFTSMMKNMNDIVIYGKYFPIGGIPIGIFNKVKSYLTIKVLKKIIREYGKPDMIHIHFPIITLTDAIVDFLISLKCKIVITEHYSRVQNKELTSQQINLLRKVTLYTDEFLCVNSILPKSIKELTGIDRNFIVVPNVVSSSFTLSENINDNKFRFISIGRLVKEKNFDLLIEAFSKKFKNISNVELLIVGGGEEYNNLKKLISSHNMKSKIKLTGFLTRQKTAELIGNCNAFVTPSHFETFGVPVIEAMSCGKPVIIADTSPLKQYVNEERGSIFKVDNVESLALSLEKLYKCYSNYDSVEIATFAEKHFSERAIGESLSSIYNRCLNNNVSKE